MKDCDCIIGIYWDYADTDLYTISRIKRFIADSGFHKRKSTKKEKVLGELDRLLNSYGRYDSYLEKFNYCPKCGRELDIDFEKMVSEVLGI